MTDQTFDVDFDLLMSYLDQRSDELGIKTLDLIETLFDLIELLFNEQVTEEQKNKAYQWVIDNQDKQL